MNSVGPQAGGILGEVAAGRSTSEVLKDILSNVQEIIRSEVRLARAEVGEEAAKAWNGARMLIAGAVLGLFALGFVLAAMALILARILPAWGAVSATALIVGAAAAVLISTGRGRMSEVHAKPQKTIETVKENVEWIKGQTRS